MRRTCIIIALSAATGLLLAACAGDDDAVAWEHGAADGGVAPPTYGDAGAAADGAAAGDPIPPEEYGKWKENDFKDPDEEPLSTFSIDVDTASYTIMRQSLSSGYLPQPEGVRVEEYINYFSYDYPEPTAKDGPFSISVDGAPSRFGAGYHMLRVGLQGYKPPEEERKTANLVFLVDVSGSMGSSNKLPLVKSALNYLVGQLEPTDTLGIVTYSSTVVELLQPTKVTSKSLITSAISKLSASGGTAGGPGIQTAYAMAKGAFIKGGINRVIVCTDGDFNIGLKGSALISLVEAERKQGVTLSVMGFGMGNYKDTFLETLSNKGNGNYAYIDSMSEAKKVFGDKLLGTLQVIAKDVKVQVEFNPKTIKKYRLVGYENRLLKPQDFVDDTKDAGEIGAGHQVTAMYEVELESGVAAAAGLASVRFRYKDPDGTKSEELPLSTLTAGELAPDLTQASADLRFTMAVVEFAEILRKSKHCSGANFAQVEALAKAVAGTDNDRLELVNLVGKAAALWP